VAGLQSHGLRGVVERGAVGATLVGMRKHKCHRFEIEFISVIEVKSWIQCFMLSLFFPLSPSIHFFGLVTFLEDIHHLFYFISTSSHNSEYRKVSSSLSPLLYIFLGL